MQVTEIITNDKLRETRMHGSPEFHFEYYLDDIHKYDKHYIEWSLNFSMYNKVLSNV